MFDLETKTHHKSPTVWPDMTDIQDKITPRVGIRFQSMRFHLDVAEALALADRLVDAAEGAERTAEMRKNAQA